MQKPTITTDIDIENDIDIDIDIELILFPKVNNIFRNYVLRSIIRGGKTLRLGAGTWAYALGNWIWKGDLVLVRSLQTRDLVYRVWVLDTGLGSGRSFKVPLLDLLYRNSNTWIPGLGSWVVKSTPPPFVLGR